MPVRLFLSICLVLLTVNDPRAADATVPFDASPVTLVAVSPVIFSGIVTELRYGFHSNSKMPYTFIKFAGVEYLRKDADVSTEAGSTLEISVAGGIRDNLQVMEVDELPRFDLGERYVIFLRGGDWRFSPITAFSAGVFRLHGRWADDALLLNYQGQPIEGVRDDRFVLARGLAKEKAAPIATQLAESALADQVTGNLLARSGTAPRDSIQEQAQLESGAATEARLEDSHPRGRFAGYGPIMRLSELRQFIDRARLEAAGRYPGFARLSLTPVARLTTGFKAAEPRSITPARSAIDSPLLPARTSVQ